jgi:hypothetical protein
MLRFACMRSTWHAYMRTGLHVFHVIQQQKRCTRTYTKKMQNPNVVSRRKFYALSNGELGFNVVSRRKFYALSNGVLGFHVS